MQPGCLVEPEREIEVLDSGAAGSLAEVVETGAEEALALFVVGKDKQLQLVRVGQ